MSQPTKICPRCKTPTDLQAANCERCGREYRTQFPQNPDRTVLGASEPHYPASYDPPRYPAQQAPQASHQQVYINVTAPAQPQLAPVIIAAPEPPTRNDLCAIFSLVFGLLGLLFFCLFGWFFGLIGLGLGITSIYRLRRDRYLDGLVIAISGIVLSALSVAFALWLAIAWAQTANEINRTMPPTQPAPTRAF